MALSGRGSELWPPGFFVSSRKLTLTFSAACSRSKIGRASRVISAPPPSFSAYSASIRARSCLSSQLTPFHGELEPSSSSAVRARIRSRSGA